MWPLCQYIPAVTNGLSDLSEVAVTKIVEEFFEGTPNFEPWVSPGVGAIDVFFECNVFDDMGGMSQWEFEVVSLHCVHATQTDWDRVEVGSVVGAIGSSSEIVDEVARGHNGKLVIEHEAHEEDCLVVFLASVSMMVTHIKQMGAILT